MSARRAGERDTAKRSGAFPERSEGNDRRMRGGCMNVQIIALGKLKEDYLREACAEYEKRLGAFCKLTITQLDPVKLPENAGESQIEAALMAEGDKILSKIPASCYTVAMCIEGKQLSSEELAQTFKNAANEGISDIAFVIGSSCGLSDKVKRIADSRLSMSKMTFPHQLARVMLLEQIYRAFTIINNRKYHK